MSSSGSDAGSPILIDSTAGTSASERPVVAVAHDDEPRRCGAVLAGVEEAGQLDRLGQSVHVGVVEDEDGRLAAELEVDALHGLRRGGR